MWNCFHCSLSLLLSLHQCRLAYNIIYRQRRNKKLKHIMTFIASSAEVDTVVLIKWPLEALSDSFRRSYRAATSAFCSVSTSNGVEGPTRRPEEAVQDGALQEVFRLVR